MNPNQIDSLSPAYFDDVYHANADPWGFEDRPYEAAKYSATLAALPRLHYKRAFEIGCSIGVLTAQLATRCDALLAVDGSELPLARARERCVGLPQVQIEQMVVPQEFPDDQFDLILVSEVGYYWNIADLATSQDLILKHLEPSGHLLLVHWTPPVHDYPLTGDEVNDSFLALSGLEYLGGRREDTYRLDLFAREATDTSHSVSRDN